MTVEATAPPVSKPYYLVLTSSINYIILLIPNFSASFRYLGMYLIMLFIIIVFALHTYRLLHVLHKKVLCLVTL